MPRRAKEKTALEVQRLVAPGLHSVGRVAGLHLRVKPSGARSWVLRATVGTLRRDIGLGAYPDTTLAMAWEKARRAREQIVAGIDPVNHAREIRSALRAAQAKAVTFEDAAEAYINAHADGWRNAKHLQQWRNSLKAYAHPVMGGLRVSDVELAHVLKVLEPIWAVKTETASRVRQRIESVMDWAKGRGYRTGDNPAAWKGNLDAQLPRPEKVATREHHAALPVGEIGAFMGALRPALGMGARALEFTILTAARSGEVRGATWSEIDLKGRVWTIPGTRMKAGKEHRVPLSDAAVSLLTALPEMAGTDVLFPAPRGGQLSDMTLSAVLRRMNVSVTVHGFRSTFRDWCGECTNYPREVCELALAHMVGNSVEQAYARGDLFEKRRRLMSDWAAFCAIPSAPDAEVVSINRARA